jgi:MFS family permease
VRRNISRFHATGQSLRNHVQLITYVDRLAVDLEQLNELLVREWSGLFGGVHLLPFFTPIAGADAGFDPVDHTEVDCRLQHGAASGVILFFTCVAAVVGPLAMGVVSDHFGDPKYGFVFATVFAALLFVALLLNQIFNPARNRLQRLDHSEYELAETRPVGPQARS